MRYEKIVESLQISQGFFDDHWETIESRLLSTGEAMEQGSRPSSEFPTSRAGLFIQTGDIFRINQCLNLATTILLLGSTSENLHKTLRKVQLEEDFRKYDPTTVVISVVLWDLLVKLEKHVNQETGEEQKEKIRRIRNVRERFDQLNWIIGLDAVRTLEIGRPAK